MAIRKVDTVVAHIDHVVGKKLQREIGRYMKAQRRPILDALLIRSQKGRHFSATTMVMLFRRIFDAAGIKDARSSGSSSWLVIRASAPHRDRVYMLRRDFDDARHHHERALVLNPNDSIALGCYGVYLTAVGHLDEALMQFDQSARNNPMQPDWVDWLRGIPFFTARRYDEAIAILRSIKDPINEVRGWLAVSYAGAGRLDEARATLEEFLRVAEEDMSVFPGRKLAAWETLWRGALEYQNEADFEHLFTALRKAGLEE